MYFDRYFSADIPAEDINDGFLLKAIDSLEKEKPDERQRFHQRQLIQWIEQEHPYIIEKINTLISNKPNLSQPLFIWISENLLLFAEHYYAIPTILYQISWRCLWHAVDTDSSGQFGQYVKQLSDEPKTLCIVSRFSVPNLTTTPDPPPNNAEQFQNSLCNALYEAYRKLHERTDKNDFTDKQSRFDVLSRLCIHNQNKAKELIDELGLFTQWEILDIATIFVECTMSISPKDELYFNEQVFSKLFNSDQLQKSLDKLSDDDKPKDETVTSLSRFESDEEWTKKRKFVFEELRNITFPQSPAKDD